MKTGSDFGGILLQNKGISQIKRGACCFFATNFGGNPALFIED